MLRSCSTLRLLFPCATIEPAWNMQILRYLLIHTFSAVFGNPSLRASWVSVYWLSLGVGEFWEGDTSVQIVSVLSSSLFSMLIKSEKGKHWWEQWVQKQKIKRMQTHCMVTIGSNDRHPASILAIWSCMELFYFFWEENCVDQETEDYTKSDSWHQSWVQQLRDLMIHVH